MLNWFTYFDQKNQIMFCPKMFQYLHIVYCILPYIVYSILYTIDAHFFSPTLKTGSISFFSSSYMQEFHLLWGCHAIGINSSLILFFAFFAFFKFNMPSQKSDMNRSIRIIFIKIKIYVKNTHFVTRKCDIARIFIKVFITHLLSLIFVKNIS